MIRTSLQSPLRLVRALLLLLTFAVATLSGSVAPTPFVVQTASAQTATPAPAEKVAPKALFPRPSAQQTQAQQPPSGPLANLYMWIAEKQQAFTRTLAGALRDIKAGNAFAASLLLVAVSFAYGVLHAAGPGHGKAIVSSYMLADNQTVRRGIWLAALSSFVQALSAVALFGIVVLVARGARTEIVNTETMLERMSWAIVAAFGAWLLFRQIKALVTGRPVHDHAHHDHSHDHHHGHVHGPSCNHGHHHHTHGHHHGQAHDHSHEPAVAVATAHVSMQPQAHAHSHAHANSDYHGHAHADGEVCETCGHAHIPTADAVQGEWSWKRALTLAFAIGIRPCTGAIGVLFVANGLGLMWAGIASTFAMSIGTAITVSTLAALAVGSRDLATRIAGTSDNSWAARTQTAIGLVGATLVFVLGSTFFFYSLSTPQPF